MVRKFVLALFLVTFLAPGVDAATLFGRVIEINDGDVITVFNLNRPVRIKLLAVDAPEAGQVFGDVAKKHLSDLVYDKSVVVEYWGIAADGSLVGRVTLDKTDVGAQMIRDGAAWFDASNQGRLSIANREVYQQSEQVARHERRGLWQADAPVAPWEFVRAQALRRDPVTSLNTVLPAAKPRPDRPTSELTNLTLIASRLASRPAVSNPVAAHTDAENILWSLEDSGPKNWKPFRPKGENFSVLVPDDGLQKHISVPWAKEMVDVNVFAARDSGSMYALMWITGPSSGESDETAINSAVQGFLYGFSEGYQRRNGEKFTCEAPRGRSISSNGFSGSDYDIPACTIPAKLRIYSRSVNGERQMYIGVVFYTEPNDTNVSRFMKSFTVSTSPHKATAQKQ